MGKVPPEKPCSPADVGLQLEEAVQRILKSDSRRKLIVAGPGTGKTTFFRKLLESSPGDRDSALTSSVGLAKVMLTIAMT